MATVLTYAANPCGAQICAGDCDADGRVDLGELVRGVNLALGSSKASCPAADIDGNGSVSVDEVVSAVAASLGPCSGSLVASGACMQPGSQGLVPCDKGMEVRVYRCEDRSRCLTEPDDPTALRVLSFGRISAQGSFTLELRAGEVSDAPLVFEAEVGPAAKYRVITFGRIGAGGGSGLDLGTIVLSPSSEAAVRLLAENGLENFAPDAVSDIIDAVAAANLDTDFSGLAAAAAATRARDVAVTDPNVIAIIEQSRRTPTATATPTPTSTSTRTPVEGPLRRVGNEFQISAFTLNRQLEPRVAMARSGAFIVVWAVEETSGDPGGPAPGIFVRRYDSAGNALGTDFQVDSFTLGAQYEADIAAVDSGFVAVWVTDGSEVEGADGIRGRRLDGEGRPAGTELVVSSSPYDYEPRVAPAVSGAFVVVWTSLSGEPYGDVLARRFDSSGEPQGPAFQINQHTSGEQTDPALAADADGGLLVAWSDGGSFGASQDGDSCGVRARRFDSTGAPAGDELQVNSHTLDCQRNPAVAALEGGFAVVWQSYDQDGFASGVFGQLFSSDGARRGSELRINAFTLGSEDDAVIAADASGFLVVWESETGATGRDGDSTATVAGRFDEQGNAVGAELQVNSFTISTQEDPAVASDGQDRFVVVWDSYDQDGAYNGAFGQLFRRPP